MGFPRVSSPCLWQTSVLAYPHLRELVSLTERITFLILYRMKDLILRITSVLTFTYSMYLRHGPSH